MKAKTIEVDAGHLSMVSHPQEIANLIHEACGLKSQGQRLTGGARDGTRHDRSGADTW